MIDIEHLRQQRDEALAAVTGYSRRLTELQQERDAALREADRLRRLLREAKGEKG